MFAGYMPDMKVRKIKIIVYSWLPTGTFIKIWQFEKRISNIW